MNLLPCPFCGGEAVLNHGHIITATGQCLANVKCSECGVATKVVWSTDSPEEAVKEAIEAWNRRVVVAKNATTPEVRTAKAEYSESDGCNLCGECGDSVEIWDRYCHNCGAKLDWSDDE